MPCLCNETFMYMYKDTNNLSSDVQMSKWLLLHNVCDVHYACCPLANVQPLVERHFCPAVTCALHVIRCIWYFVFVSPSNVCLCCLLQARAYLIQLSAQLSSTLVSLFCLPIYPSSPSLLTVSFIVLSPSYLSHLPRPTDHLYFAIQLPLSFLVLLYFKKRQIRAFSYLKLTTQWTPSYLLLTFQPNQSKKERRYLSFSIWQMQKKYLTQYQANAPPKREERMNVLYQTDPATELVLLPLGQRLSLPFPDSKTKSQKDGLFIHMRCISSNHLFLPLIVYFIC